MSCFVFYDIHNSFSKFQSTFASFSPSFRKNGMNPYFITKILNFLYLIFSIVCKGINSYNRFNIEFSYIFNMLLKICKSFFNISHIRYIQFFFSGSSVMTQSSDRCHQHNCLRIQISRYAFDIEEFLGTKISTKSCFRNYVF